MFGKNQQKMWTCRNLIEDNTVKFTAVDGVHIQKHIIALCTQFIKNQTCKMFAFAAAIGNENPRHRPSLNSLALKEHGKLRFTNFACSLPVYQAMFYVHH